MNDAFYFPYSSEDKADETVSKQIIIAVGPFELLQLKNRYICVVVFAVAFVASAYALCLLSFS